MNKGFLALMAYLFTAAIVVLYGGIIYMHTITPRNWVLLIAFDLLFALPVTGIMAKIVPCMYKGIWEEWREP
jgi:hypothetical protein